MRSALLARLKRLETTSIPDHQAKFRYGWLMPLPADYTGERHIVVTNVEASKSPKSNGAISKSGRDQRPRTRRATLLPCI